METLQLRPLLFKIETYFKTDTLLGIRLCNIELLLIFPEVQNISHDAPPPILTIYNLILQLLFFHKTYYVNPCGISHLEMPR